MVKKKKRVARYPELTRGGSSCSPLRSGAAGTAARCLAELEAGSASFAPCLRAAAAAGAHLTHAGWEGRPEWRAIHDGLRPAQCDLPEPGERCQGWQPHGSRACSTRFRDTELLPALAPPAQALLRSQSGPRAAAWLGTVPSEAGTTIPPDRMLIALRRRLRLPLPVAQGRCGAHGPGCGAAVDVYGDHYAACPRTGLLARRAKPLERAWIRVVREAIGPEGQVVPQQWLVRTPAPGVDPDDRRRLDFVAYGATQLGEALCCDVTLVSPLARDGRPQPSSTTRDGAALAVAERRKRAAYPELIRRGPQKAVRARVRDRRTMERRVAPPRRTVRPLASLACSCSAPRSCHSGLVQAVVGPAQCGCAKHACCHFARNAASPRPHAWRAGAASAGRPARRVPACAQLPAGPLSRCSLPFSSQVHWDRVRIARKVLGKKKKNDECQQFLRLLLRLRVQRAPPRCARPRHRAGPAVGGACCPSPCNALSPALRSGCGPCRRCRAPMTHFRWATCLTSRVRARPVGCRFANAPSVGRELPSGGPLLPRA